jgi:tripartite-type tricarboxylate transporter receptor subunit TctC
MPEIEAAESERFTTVGMCLAGLAGPNRSPIMPRSFRFVAAVAICFAASAAQADPSYPNRTVNLIVPFPPGGPTDGIMRLFGEAMAKHWGQSVVVHNRPGGSTIVGTQAVKQAPADGYTLGAAVGPFATNPAVRKKLPYDTLKDFTPVSMIAEEFMVLAAHKSVKADNVAELVALARKTSPSLTYATPSVGGSVHLAAEMFKIRSGIDLLQVPYTGSAKALVDLVAGRVNLMFGVWHSMKPHVESGSLKIIAVAHAQRLKDAPQYPTIGETYPGFGTVGFEGIFVRSETPAAIVDKMAKDIRTVVRKPEVASYLQKHGADPLGSSPDEFRKFLVGEIAKYTEVAAAAKVKVD